MSKLFRNRRNAAAIALGAGALAPWISAEAAVVTSGPINLAISQVDSGSTYYTTFDYGGESVEQLGFYIHHNYKGNIYGTSGAMAVREPGPTATNYAAERMQVGDIVGPGDNFDTVYSSGLGGGEWTHSPGDSLTGYIGTQFTGSSGTQYGWIHLTIDYSPTTDIGTSTITLHDWAYESEANTAISVIPETSATLFIAFAAVLCLTKRGRRQSSER